jgi:hypothetical protein
MLELDKENPRLILSSAFTAGIYFKSAIKRNNNA